jgi:Flp pilus assembly pilin Flp
MRNAFWRVREVLCALHPEDSGQDLAEYALVAVAIALASSAGMGLVAESVNSVFLALSSRFQNAG